MCEPKSLGGGGDLLPPPLPGKWGGEHPPAPPVPTPMFGSTVYISLACHQASRNDPTLTQAVRCCSKTSAVSCGAN